MSALNRGKELAGGFTRRGACPALSAPMQTGDGLLVRLNPVAGGLSPKALIGLCNAARRHGNGIVEVTARGSLQIRGLSPQSAAALALDVDALGIEVRTGVSVQTGALAGIDPDEIADPSVLADTIRAGIADRELEGRLGPKVSVVVDGGGRSTLHDVAADVRLTAVRDGLWQVAVAGGAETAELLGQATQQGAINAALEILGAVARLGLTARAKDLKADTLDMIAPRFTAPPSVLPDISPTRGEISSFNVGDWLISPPVGGPKDGPRPAARARASGRTEEGVKERDLDCLSAFPLTNSRHALGVALPFGQTTAETLIAFAKTAENLGVADIRMAPKRTVQALCPSISAAEALQHAAANLGLITTASDPRRTISACPGAPACASGHIAARDIAAAIAADCARSLDGSFDLHVSGCAKGCAHPAKADVTLVGSEKGAGIVVAGTARDVPLAYTARDDAKRALKSLLDLIRARKGAGNSSQSLRGLGPPEIARVFGRP